MNLIFVYGTLKRGHCRAAFLSGQTFLGLAATVPDYRLVRLDGFPGLIDMPLGSGLPIEGELWSVDDACLVRLDAEEDVDTGLYQRRAVRLQAESFVASQDSPQVSESLSLIPLDQVEAYFYLRSVVGKPDCGVRF